MLTEILFGRFQYLCLRFKKFFRLMNHIRNFCIIAHIDHGKSTLADRLIQLTHTLSDRDFKDQVLDNMDLERERGITIKSHAIQMEYEFEGKKYILNLIDTPGHVDFSYEVSRAIAACEGALLVVDATQGIQAQTISNLYQAVDHGLEIIPVLNKMDSPSAMPDEVKDQIMDLTACNHEDIIEASARTGMGVEKIIEQIIRQIPPPKGNTVGVLECLERLEQLTHAILSPHFVLVLQVGPRLHSDPRSANLHQVVRIAPFDRGLGACSSKTLQPSE